MCNLSISYNERRDGGTEENAGGRELQQVAEIQILGACFGGSGLRTSEGQPDAVLEMRPD